MKHFSFKHTNTNWQINSQDDRMCEDEKQFSKSLNAEVRVM